MCIAMHWLGQVPTEKTKEKKIGGKDGIWQYAATFFFHCN